MATPDKAVHVAVAVIEDNDGNILIAKRPDHVHQGGYWEFPGGKVESDETIETALTREIREELNLLITRSQPLITIPHTYPDKTVFLDVHRVTEYSGKAIGNEGQLIKWVNKFSLRDFEFPKANAPVIDAVELPDKYLITPDYNPEEHANYFQILENLLRAGIRLVQLRAKSLKGPQLTLLYEQVKSLTDKYGAILQFNTSLSYAQKLNIKNIHLTTSALMNTSELPDQHFISASCHNQAEVLKACELGVKFIVIAPVNKTNTHPDAVAIGWDTFAKLCRLSTVPIFALGGMSSSDIPVAIENGGQGIAAISALWAN